MKNAEWTAFYIDIATALLAYKTNRQNLFNKIKELAAGEPLLNYLHFNDLAFWQERENQIDPFTVMGTFNRGISAEHRTTLAQKLAEILNIRKQAPDNFHGIAHLDPRNSIFNGNNELWDFFIIAMSNKLNKQFNSAYDTAIAQHGNGQAKLTIALFWCQPFTFMALDGLSIPFINSKMGLMVPKGIMDGAEYLEFLKNLKDSILKRGISGFPELAYLAWAAAHSSEANNLKVNK